MKVSVPLQGTYLPYETLEQHCMTEFNRIVSVPLQGTYLPYQDAIALEINGEMVSVPLQGTYLPYSRTVTGTDYFFRPFPSPCRGLIFLTKKNITVNTQRESFRPLAGDLSSLQNY